MSHVLCVWQAGGFSLEVSNTNPSNVMVGVRVLVGSQSVDRAPSYIDIFGRTHPVQSFLVYMPTKLHELLPWCSICRPSICLSVCPSTFNINRLFCHSSQPTDLGSVYFV